MKSTSKLIISFIGLFILLFSCSKEEDKTNQENYLEVVITGSPANDFPKDDPDNVLTWGGNESGKLYIANEGGAEVQLHTAAKTTIIYWNELSNKVTPNKPVNILYKYKYYEGIEENLTAYFNGETNRTHVYKKTVNFLDNRRYKWSPIDDTFEDTGAWIEDDNTDDGNGGGNTESDCTDWKYYLTECLSSGGVSGENSSAGIRQMACIISETATTMTVEVTIEPANGGIDESANYAKGVDISFRGIPTYYLPVSDFNNGGSITKTITANKSDINQHWLDNWKTKGSIAFVEATCKY